MFPSDQGPSITLFNFDEPFAENSKYVLTSPRSLKVSATYAHICYGCFGVLTSGKNCSPYVALRTCSYRVKIKIHTILKKFNNI